MKWKAETLDYDFVNAESTDEVCVTLTRQQALFLYSAVNMFNWSTRWYSASGGAVNIDYVQSMIADTISRLQTGLDGECLAMAVVDIDFVNDPCSLVIEFSNGTTKTIPFEGTCLMPEPVMATNYVKHIFAECEGGQIAYLEYDASLEIDVTKFVSIEGCLPTIPTFPSNIITALTCSADPENVGLAITTWEDGEYTGEVLSLVDCFPAVVEDISINGDTCEVYGEMTDGTTRLLDTITHLDCIVTDGGAGVTLGRAFYEPDYRCRAAQVMVDNYVSFIIACSLVAQTVGAVDEQVFIPLLGYAFDKSSVLTASIRMRNMVVADLVEINTYFTVHRHDPTLTCLFYDLIPANMRIPGTFADDVANALAGWIVPAAFTTAQAEAVTQSIRAWSSHTFEMMVLESLMRPDYESYCEGCLPDIDGDWLRQTNFANNSGVPPHTITGATRIVGTGLIQTNLAVPIEITFDYVVDQCCVKIFVAGGDHMSVTMTDIATGTTLLTQGVTPVTSQNFFVEWVAETDIPYTEEGIKVTIDFDNLGDPSTVCHVGAINYHGLNTTPPSGMITGYACE